MNDRLKYRFYDKRVKKMYYPNSLQMGAFLEGIINGQNKDFLIPMQATGIYDATKFKNLSPEQQEKWLKYNTKESWPGIEIYEGDVTAVRYNKECAEYGVVSYYAGGYQKGGTALSSYQKNTTVVGNIFEGYPEKAQFAVDFYNENFRG